MKNWFTLIFILLHCVIYSIYGKGNILSGALWRKDGRSLALGGGMNGTEQSASAGIVLNVHLPYGLRELSNRSIMASFPTKWMLVDGYWGQAGDITFLENYLSLGVSRNLSGSFLLGVKMGYYRCALISDEKGSALTSEILCRYKPSEYLNVQIYLFNPTGSKINHDGKGVPIYQSFHVGGSFFISEKTAWLAEIEKVILAKPILHLGLEYAAWDSFILRTGFSTAPFKPSWGIGGRVRSIRYALGGNIHPVLGISTCLTFSYQW